MTLGERVARTFSISRNTSTLDRTSTFTRNESSKMGSHPSNNSRALLRNMTSFVTGPTGGCQDEDDFLDYDDPVGPPPAPPQDASFRRQATLKRAQTFRRQTSSVESEHVPTDSDDDGDAAPPVEDGSLTESEIWAGRPDLVELLADVAEEAKLLGETHVALMICGAGGVVSKVRQLAAKGGYGGVQFDVHHEAFGFG